MPYNHHNHDEHDLGFAHDLPRLLGRRRFLSLLGAVGAVVASRPAAALECVALPWETAGPYPGDGTNAKDGQTVNVLVQEGVIREDLRASFGAFSGEADGVRLDLELTVQDADGCKPLEGHAIYLWHCDATGDYSLYDKTAANFLRGVGVADANGLVRFTTIFPGCYAGRWPHMHFEIFESVGAAVSGGASVLTAQIALPEGDCADVYGKDARYPNGTRNLQRLSLGTDNVFSDNTQAQLDQQTLALSGDPTSGYSGSLAIPVDFNAERSAGMAPPPRGFDGKNPPPPPGK